MGNLSSQYDAVLCKGFVGVCPEKIYISSVSAYSEPLSRQLTYLSKFIAQPNDLAPLQIQDDKWLLHRGTQLTSLVSDTLTSSPFLIVTKKKAAVSSCQWLKWSERIWLKNDIHWVTVNIWKIILPLLIFPFGSISTEFKSWARREQHHSKNMATSGMQIQLKD